MSEKRVSDMSDDEVRQMAGAGDPLAAELARIDAGNEAYIKRLALTDATVATMPSGDLRKALKALGAVLRDHEPRTRIPPNRHYAICRACSRIWPCATVQDITKALLTEEEPDGS